MTDDLKLAAAERALKGHLHNLDDDGGGNDHGLRNFISKSDVVALYHTNITCQYNDQTLLYLLAVDSLFFLGMLHRGPNNTPQDNSYFLTGKRGMPLVNNTGVELTMDVLVRDVFMLENQLPTHILNKLWEVIFKDIETHQSDQHKNLFSAMQAFCKEFCPLGPIEEENQEVFANPQGHYHLLDIMYHMIVTDPSPAATTVLPQEHEHEGSDEDNEQVQGDETTPLISPPGTALVEGDETTPLISPLALSSSLTPETTTMPVVVTNTVQHPPSAIGCCHVFFTGIIIFTFAVVLLGYAIYKLVEFVLKLCWRIFKGLILRLFSVLYWALRPLWGPLVKFSESLYPHVDGFYCGLQNETDLSHLKPLKPIVGRVKRALEKIVQVDLESTDHSDKPRPNRTIPSATELHKAGINFKAVPKRGTSSVDFDDKKSMFYLPCIRLDVNSEVIIRNLVAFESLTKSNDLVFTRYIEMMRGIIASPHDVHLLVNSEIIHTQLSDEVVKQIFSGMSKPIRPTKAQKLEQVVKKINAKFDDAQKQQKAMAKYVSYSGKIFAAIAALVFLALTAMQTYCSVFGCSP